MAEYIEREAALKTLKKSLIFCESEFDTGEYRNGCIAAIQDDIGNIKHLPAADVVEVVRCKDCKHCAIREYDIIDELECEFFDVFTDALDYCSRGERKVDNGR